jgi:hypothetical protein
VQFLRGTYAFCFSTFTAETDSDGFDDKSVFASLFGPCLARGSSYQKRVIKQSMVDRKRDFDQLQSEMEMMVEILSGRKSQKFQQWSVKF